MRARIDQLEADLDGGSLSNEERVLVREELVVVRKELVVLRETELFLLQQGTRLPLMHGLCMAPPVSPLHGFSVSLGTCDQPPLTAPPPDWPPLRACRMHHHSALMQLIETPHLPPRSHVCPAALLCTHSGRNCADRRRTTRCVWEWMGAGEGAGCRRSR